MKKILLLLVLISFSAFGQPNPDYHRYGVRTPFTKYISYTTAQRDALTPTSTDRTIIHHKDTGINRLEQWDGDSWEELGGDGAVSSVNFKTGAVVIDPDDLDDSATTNKFVIQEEKDLIFTALQDAPSDGNEYVRKDGDWEVATGGGDNIYNTDGTLEGDRSINIGEHNLSVKDSLGMPLLNVANEGFQLLNIDGDVSTGVASSNLGDRIISVTSFNTSTSKVGLFVLKNTDSTSIEMQAEKFIFNIEGTTPDTGDVLTLQPDGTTKFQTPSGGGATNAENVIVSPSIGGNTDAYAVMDDHEDRIDALESSSGGSTVISMPIEQKLDNWLYKLENSPSTATLAFVGDSTSDLSGNASSLDELIDSFSQIGFPTEAFDVSSNMPNFGSNGQTIVGFISDVGSKGLAELVSAQLDLIIFSFGINDIRQNNLTKDQLKNHIITCVNAIKAGSPNTDIILRTPNSFDIPVNDTYIKQGGYASLADAAQAQTDILWQAYKELEFYWSDVILFDTQELIYGRTSSAITPSVLHSDEIHPIYDPMVAYLVENIIGYEKPFREDEAIAAIQGSSTPWGIYPRVFEQETDFIKLGEGTVGARGSGYNFFNVTNNQAYVLSQNYTFGDYISIGNGSLVVKNESSLDFNNASRVNYPVTLAGNTFPEGTKVEFFRPRYNNQSINKRYLADKGNFPYARRVKIGFANNGNFLITELLDDDIITKKTKGITPKMLEMSTSDVVVFADGTVLTLTGASFSNFSGGRYVTVTGNFTDYLDTVAFIYSNRDYENLIKTNTVSLVAGTATVSDPNITASSEVQVTLKTVSGTVGTYHSISILEGSFTITSESATDTSTLTYTIYN